MNKSNKFKLKVKTISVYILLYFLLNSKYTKLAERETQIVTSFVMCACPKSFAQSETFQELSSGLPFHLRPESSLFSSSGKYYSAGILICLSSPALAIVPSFMIS